MKEEVRRLSDIVLPAYKEFWHTDKTYVICKGSRGSGKSKQTALWIIYHMKKYPLSNTLVVRKVGRTLKDSCFADLLWAIDALGMESEWKYTVAPLEIIHRKTGQKILFRGLDDGQKVTSVAVPKGVLNYLWFEELYEITKEDDFDIIDESVRGELPDGYFKRVIATFNPWSDKHFAKKRFFDNPSHNVLAMTTTYKDNPRLSEEDLLLFEDMKRRKPKRYKVAGLGEWGIIEGVVFEDWKEEYFTLDTVAGCRPLTGLDFGYTNDPTALFVGYISENEKRIYVWDEIYKTGLTNKMIYEQIVSAGYGRRKITGDSAEPKTIDELYSYGLDIRGALKGKDSVNNGIQFIQNYEIVVHPRCVNFITEISNYTWDKDRFGKKLNAPVDDFNHLMDAMRYSIESYMKENQGPQYNSVRGGL